MSDALLDECIAKMASNLEHLNIAIRRHTLRGMQALGLGRADVLTMVLPKLVDTEVRLRLWKENLLHQLILCVQIRV